MSWVELSSSFKPGIPRVKVKARKRKSAAPSPGKNRRRFYGFTLYILVLAGAVAAIRRVLLTTQYFEVTSIEISNLQTFSEEDILEISGLEPGENIFRVNPAIYRDRLLAETNIEDAAVFRIFPDTLRVNILERQPRARVRYGRYYTIDGWGVVLRGEKERGAENLPLISGPRLSVSDGRLHPAGEVADCLTLLRELDARDLTLALEITEIAISRSGVMDIKTASGHEVRISRDNMIEQLEHLRALLPHLAGERDRRAAVDLRYYPNVPVRYR